MNIFEILIAGLMLATLIISTAHSAEVTTEWRGVHWQRVVEADNGMIYFV